MKWLKLLALITVGIIVLATASLAALNLRPDSDRLQNSLIIHRSAPEVWPWLWEPEKMKGWISWLKEVNSDSPGPPALGTTAVLVMEDKNNNGALMKISSTVEKVEPERFLLLGVKSGNEFQGKVSYRLLPVGDGTTQLTSDSRFRFGNAFFRFLTPLVLWEAKKKTQGDLERLRALLEAPH